ncbi:hypothetical protein ZWY2020_034880 [Hordeum vulgare]|nr:hypothetical protein ZWY2020_034880 [Hordeum vulgare]
MGKPPAAAAAADNTGKPPAAAAANNGAYSLSVSFSLRDDQSAVKMVVRAPAATVVINPVNPPVNPPAQAASPHGAVEFVMFTVFLFIFILVIGVILLLNWCLK